MVILLKITNRKSKGAFYTPREIVHYMCQQSLIVREITNPKIIACYLKEEFVNDSQIISIIKNKNNLLPLWTILNSRLATFYHFTSSPKATKGAFPKILVKDIKEFPIPEWDKTSILIDLVDKILSITKDEDYLENPDKQSKVRKIEREIDLLVYKLYDLTDDEIKIVEDFCKK